MPESNRFSGRIAVVADTHDRLPAALVRRLADAAEIWHLGDVCDAAVLAALEALGSSVLVVRGNNDAHGWPLVRTEIRGGVRFHLVHIPPSRAPAGAEVVLHGHTHVPCDYTSQGVRWLNPGAVFRPRCGSAASFAWLSAEDGLVDWCVETLE